MKRTFAAIATATALAAFTAMPASAAPLVASQVYLNGFVWDLNIGETSTLEEGEFVEPGGSLEEHDYEVDGDYFEAYYGDAIDGITWEIWNEDTVNPLQPTCETATVETDEPTGDVIVTCTPANAFDIDSDLTGDISYTTEYRFLNVGPNAAIARVSLIITNDTDAALDFGWQLTQSFGECYSGLTSTGSGDTEWQLADGWVQCASDETWEDNDNVTQGAEASVTYAYGHPDASDFPEVFEILDEDTESTNTMPDDENAVWSDEDEDGLYSSLAVDETQTITYFVATRIGPDEIGIYGEYEEQDLTDFSDCAFSDGLGERLLSGMGTTPINWIAGGNDCELGNPALAETGVDVSGAITFGALALAAGSAAVIARRRRA